MVLLTSIGSLSTYFRTSGVKPRDAFPLSGWLLAGIGLVAMISQGRLGRLRAALLVACGLVGALIALGPRASGLGLYDLMSTWVPGFCSLREPFRARVLVDLGLAIAGGIGVATLTRWRAPIGALFALALVVLALPRDWPLPVPMRELSVGRNLAPAYRYLARCGAGDPLLELPMPSLLENWKDAERELYSVFHWLPLLNGRTGYTPPLQERVVALAAQLPAPGAVAALRELTGVRWILVHCDPRSRAFFGRSPLCWRGLDAAAAGYKIGDDLLFDLGPPATRAAWLPARPAVPADCNP
jgi:hypothetical protein